MKTCRPGMHVLVQGLAKRSCGILGKSSLGGPCLHEDLEDAMFQRSVRGDREDAMYWRCLCESGCGMLLGGSCMRTLQDPL